MDGLRTSASKGAKFAPDARMKRSTDAAVGNALAEPSPFAIVSPIRVSEQPVKTTSSAGLRLDGDGMAG